uniref:hypothetical protein n=1 Tax=Gemmiger formicilis TaxID=745368 RepID=UPI003FEF1E7C
MICTKCALFRTNGFWFRRVSQGFEPTFCTHCQTRHPDIDFFRTNNAPCTAFADAGGVKLHFLFLLRLPQRNQHTQLKPTL